VQTACQARCSATRAVTAARSRWIDAHRGDAGQWVLIAAAAARGRGRMIEIPRCAAFSSLIHELEVLFDDFDHEMGRPQAHLACLWPDANPSAERHALAAARCGCASLPTHALPAITRSASLFCPLTHARNTTQVSGGTRKGWLGGEESSNLSKWYGPDRALYLPGGLLDRDDLPDYLSGELPGE
jgi:hypothetical protein